MALSVAEKLISLRRSKLFPQRVDAMQAGCLIEMKSVYREHLEHVQLSFARMKQEYVVQNPIDSSQGMVTAFIDVKANTTT